ncbi:4'-phosphopantetheinyl transferase [Amycolatopsis marina]|uniref:4'-phosphopantetheinyl transferase n=1 Tax=Amycolatopsis marina TaxID=490629 RepID=A0A1I1BIR9_9PSEU|nr:4'-phosphopantetheinyl transferase superfamily protein [Amycolatopsis marina]SFB48678.1 4'-phosphopantetheinyl transferase [Amycolatopsis marina]
MIDCAVWWATPIAETGEFLPLLSQLETERYGAYRQELDQRRFLTGRVLAKTLVAARLGVTPGSVRFDATCADCGKHHGPPRVPDAPIKFSISHSGERVGIALTDRTPVGLDVETANRRADESLIDYALSDEERRVVHALPEDERANAFFTYWTRKEAVMKATGKGLRIPLRGITLAPPGESAHLLASDDESLSPERTRLADLTPGSGYRAAVALLTDQEIAVTEHEWSPS